MERKIAFDLLTNAVDSFERAVELLVQGDRRTDHGSLKGAITSAAHCVELLLKERLRQINPAFIWEKVDQYPSLDARTVAVDSAIARLQKIGGVHISDDEARNLKSLRKTRNAIEHYEWTSSVNEARTIVAHALSFALDFARRELGVDLSVELKGDDTWTMFCDGLYAFVRVHGECIERRLQAAGELTQCCDSCGNLTISIFGGSCELCGHWQATDDPDEN